MITSTLRRRAGMCEAREGGGGAGAGAGAGALLGSGLDEADGGDLDTATTLRAATLGRDRRGVAAAAASPSPASGDAGTDRLA